MRIAIHLAAIATLSMAAAPATAAGAAPVPKVSASPAARAGSEVDRSDQLTGGISIIIPLVALAALIAAILIIDHNNDKPNSP